MKLREMLSGIEILESAADMDAEIGGISYDSRHTRPGDLFAAVVGFESDGHDYIPMAMEKGAAAVLCQTAPERGDYVRVADTRYALAIASKNFFGDPAGEMTMIGVTGTNGKTTSTLLIKHVFEHCRGAKVGLIGTTGNMIGDELLPSERTTPESFELQKLLREMADAGCEYVVMEVSSHALALSRVAGIEYELGIFTNLTQDHLDFHGGMEQYAEAKARLFSQCRRASLNCDDEYFAYMKNAARCPVTAFSAAGNDAGLAAKDISLRPDRVSFLAVARGEAVSVNLAIPGRFSVYNALGVISGCMALGLTLGECADALASARGVKGRAESVPTDGDYTVLIDYAHTPDALENILRAVRETSSGRVVALFGCGGDRDRKKRPIMGEIGVRESDLAIITSDNPRTEDPDAIIADIVEGIHAEKSRYKVISDRVKAIEWAIENHQSGDVIVLAGKGHETYQEINHVKHHMDEREIVAEILERRKNK
ncbi:MAG: UDP-N-acetylmuramoyl-L-alanyl-D-glutamate--2,6-diaminopimelate ligase [Butyricicoccus sp.]|nr:UDP-N-acetylmuramoyl-L-alanyl-D-glutamate--2,6-diaminopimelate ligase [Butyricicoccus sp.]